jgi:DNA-binding CsgD family transcriptional regulator
VLAVVARLRAIEQGTGETDLLPRLRLRAPSGQWLVVHASRVSGADAHGLVAVFFEPARPSVIAPLIVQAYGLSEREREVTGLVLRGLSTAEIAGELHISNNTVQDHLKAVFEKVGVRSRREMVASVFSDHYWPRMVAGKRIGPSGWFAEDKTG